MPNGGIDNCGTCWFNSANEGQHGHGNWSDPEFNKREHRCLIRDFKIAIPSHTYCSNHPYVRGRKDAIPIGPVYVHDEQAPPDGPGGAHRRIYLPSPDSPTIRQRLFVVVTSADGFEPSDNDIPAYYGSIESKVTSAIWQLGEFKDNTINFYLEKLAAFDEPSFERTSRVAREALSKINAVDNATAGRHFPQTRSAIHFSVRDLLWLMVVVGMAIG